MAQTEQQQAIEKIQADIDSKRGLAEIMAADITVLDEEATQAGINGNQSVMAYKITQKEARRKEYDALTKQIETMVKNLDKAKKMLVNEDQEAAKNDDASAIQKVAEKYHMGYLANDKKYVFCKNTAVTMDSYCHPRFETATPDTIVDQLALFTGRDLTMDHLDVKALMFSLKRVYQTAVGSFKFDKWNPTHYYNKAQVLKDGFWAQPSDEESEHAAKFEFLFHCLGGGKEENIKHLKQWILHKHQFPEKSENTPSLDISGVPGGNGKGLFFTLLRTIFTADCVKQAAAKELDEGFNSNWDMATILYYDESNTNKLSSDALKRLTGNDTFRSEAKGKDAYEADRNFNFLFTSNSGKKGVVPLSGGIGGGEDRRWSVVKTNISMQSAAAKYFNVTQEQGNAVVNEIAQLVKNRAEVEKLLGRIKAEIGTELQQNLAALHGVDYQEQLDFQRTDISVVYDAIIQRAKLDGGISLKLVKALVKALILEPMKDRQIVTDFEAALSREGIKFKYDDSKYVQHMWNGKTGYKEQIKYWSFDGAVDRKIEYTQYLSLQPIPSSKNWAETASDKAYLVDGLTALGNM